MKQTTFPIEVGQKVIAQPCGNARYYYVNKPYIDGVINKIARKYFYVQFNYRTEKFEIDTFNSKCDDCNAHYILYASLQDFQNEEERVKMWRDLRNMFSWENENKLTYEKVKAIYDIAIDKE